MINSADENDNIFNMLKNKTSPQYIKDKFDSTNKKIVIGKGSFGKVRFALTLYSPENTKSNIGDLICVKKSE